MTRTPEQLRAAIDRHYRLLMALYDAIIAEIHQPTEIGCALSTRILLGQVDDGVSE